MIDIHAHILPGLDDGAPDMTMTMKMLYNAWKCETKAIIATPHYYSGHFETDYEEVSKSVALIKSEAKARELDIEIYTGQEVFLDKHTVDLFKRGIIRGLNNTRYMLVEMPMASYSGTLIETIYELRLLGIVPIIAHPERYSYIMGNLNNINPFIDEGCLFQINTGSITGIFGKTVQKTARMLIENGVCNFVASDAHTDGRRCTGIAEAIEAVKKINREAAKDAVINGDLLIQNDEIKSSCERISVKKSFFSFLK